MLKGKIAKDYNLGARLHKKIDCSKSKESSVDAGKKTSQGQDLDDQSISNQNYLFSENQNPMSFPVTNVLSIQNQTQHGTSRFGAKNNSLIQQPIPHEGFQKFGDKKNTT